jgi:hypothetical protein
LQQQKNTSIVLHITLTKTANLGNLQNILKPRIGFQLSQPVFNFLKLLKKTWMEADGSPSKAAKATGKQKTY